MTSHQDEHSDDCQRLLNNDWKEVHLWLDALFKEYGPAHRRHRHHVEGIEEIRKMWGDEAAMAAKIHIIADCWGIPNKTDYSLGWVDEFGFTPDATRDEAEVMLESVRIEFLAMQIKLAWEARRESAELKAALSEIIQILKILRTLSASLEKKSLSIPLKTG